MRIWYQLSTRVSCDTNLSHVTIWYQFFYCCEVLDPGAWLYRFLIFAPLLTIYRFSHTCEEDLVPIIKNVTLSYPHTKDWHRPTHVRYGSFTGKETLQRYIYSSLTVHRQTVIWGMWAKAQQNIYVCLPVCLSAYVSVYLSIKKIYCSWPVTYLSYVTALAWNIAFSETSQSQNNPNWSTQKKTCGGDFGPPKSAAFCIRFQFFTVLPMGSVTTTYQFFTTLITWCQYFYMCEDLVPVIHTCELWYQIFTVVRFSTDFLTRVRRIWYRFFTLVHSHN